MNTEDKTLKEKIEGICEEYFGLTPSDKWDQRVREGASKEISSLIRELIHEAKPEKINSENTGIYDDVYPKGFNDGTHEYEQSLLEKIGGEYIWHEEKK